MRKVYINYDLTCLSIIIKPSRCHVYQNVSLITDGGRTNFPIAGPAGNSLL